MAEMTPIEFQIVGHTENAVVSLQRLRKELSKLQGIHIGDLGLKGASKEISTFAKAVNKINIDKFKALNGALRGMSGFGKTLDAMDKFAKAPEKMEEAFSKLESYLQGLSKIDFSNLEKAAAGLQGIVTSAKLVESAGKSTSSQTPKFWSNIMKVAKFPFKTAANHVGKYAGAMKTLGSSLARIAMYRMLRSVIKEVTDAFKQGTNNLYQWSKAVGGATISGKNFAETMDSLASASAYLKNSIGAAVAPFISALAPAIDFAIGKIVALINVINQLLALLGGGLGWNKATYQAKEYADAAGGAGGAAKEALKYLAPFDELNVLPDDNKGGGGGGATEAYESMFEHMEEFSEKIANFAQMVKEAWASGDWHDVGVFIGEKINEAINNVPWADIGATLGKAINALIGTEYWTLSETDFVNLGNKIAEFFNNALENIHFDIAGRLQVRELTAIIDTIIGFLEGLDWKLVGKSIGDYLKGALAEITDWFEKTDFNTLGQSLVNGLFDLVSGLDLKNVAIGLWNALISAIQATISLSSGLVETLWNKIIGFIEGKSGFDLSFLKIDLDGLEEFINEQLGGLKLKPVEVPVEGNVTKITVDRGIKRQHQKAPLTGYVTDLNTDDLRAEKKTLRGMTAQITEVNTDGLTPDQKTVDTNANFTTKTEGRQFNTNFPSRADFKERLIDGMSTSFNSEADFKTKKTSGGFDTKFPSEAEFVSKTTGGKFDTKFPSIAEFKQRVINGLSTNFDSIAKFVSRQTGGKFSNVFDALAKFIKWENALKSDPTINVRARIVSTDGGTNTDRVTAEGGIFSGGRWHNIPQYASGGRPHGSLFLAGEAGAELVGHVGGHTEVLNQSQLAAVMSSSVAKAIAGTHFTLSGMPVMSYGANDQETNEDAMYRAFRRALDETDFSPEINIDGEPLYRSVVRYNNQNTRATGVNQLATA